MNQKLTALLQQRSRLFGLFVGVLGIALLAASAVGFWNDQHLANYSPTPQVSVAEAADNPQPQQTTSVPPAESQPAATQETQPKQTKKQPAPPAATAGATTTSSQPEPAAEPANVQVSLKVDDVPKGSVTLPKGSNQCDVLQRALDDGIISSLTMKYNAAYKSYGVYVIDGIGDSSNVWWGYKVNGKSPPLGCSHVLANNGDSVHWEYVK